MHEHHDPGDEDRRADLYCRNCGDPFGPDAENAAIGQPSGTWRPCPFPSPGRPLVDCGVGGHMYTDATPPTCDWHPEHDDDGEPVGKRCGVSATHRIEWLDGTQRYSFGCSHHLTMDGHAPKLRIAKLSRQDAP